MRTLLFLACLSATCVFGQKASVTVTDDSFDKKGMDRATRSLFELLEVEHYTARFKLPGNKAHDVVLVMKSVFKDSIASVDTLINSVPWRKKVVGGLVFDPRELSTLVGQHIDSVHYRIRFRFGSMNMTDRTVKLPWPNHGYLLDEGLRSAGDAVPFEIGKPMPIMVLTQPYPDPPPPEQVVFYRYCFGTDIPPADWPKTFGVPHLYIFELTLLP